MRAKGLKVHPGSFAENITTEGLELYTLPVGTRMRLGTALAEVTQIGKVCHNRCAIYEQAGDCIMPKEGIFARVLEGAVIRPDDPVTLLAGPRDVPRTPKQKRRAPRSSGKNRTGS